VGCAAPSLPVRESTGSLTLVTLVMAGFGVVTLGCALAFPDRRETGVVAAGE